MRRKRSGYILVLTLAVLTAVIAVLAGASAAQRLAYDAQINRQQELRARIAAESALQLAITVLSTQSTSTTTPGDAWNSVGSQGNDNFKISSGTFRMQILDAGSQININSAPQQQLQNLPLTTEQVDSLLDWRSPGTQPRTDGAKDEYYNGLAKPYNASEAPFKTVDELLLVRNFTPSTLFQVNNTVQTSAVPPTSAVTGNPVPLYDLLTVDSASINSASGGATTGGTTGGGAATAAPAKLNANTATLVQMTGRRIPRAVAQAIITQRGRNANFYTSYATLLNVRGVTTANAALILNTLSFNSTTAQTGKINLNTAQQDVLTTIPNITTDLAQSIITRQQNAGFTQLGDVAALPGITMAELRQLADQVSVNSSAFLVRVIGSAGTLKYPLEAIITLKNGTATISKITRPPYSNMIPIWGWQDTTTNDVDLTTGT